MTPIELGKLSAGPIVAAFAGVEPNAVLVLAGAVIIAAIAVRSQAMKLVKEDRDEQRRAREAAEAELKTLKEQPNVDKLWQLMEQHEKRSREHGELTVKAMEDVSSSLRANTEAIRLWATTRASEF